MPNAYPAAPTYTFPGTSDVPSSNPNCDPRLIVVDEANGSTLTRAKIRAFTRQDFEDQQMKEVGMDRIIAQTKEARMAGVREKALIDLFLSRHVALKTSKGGGSQSIIAPYTLVPRRNVVNANYFQIEAGAAHANAGSAHTITDTRVPASERNITLHTGAWYVTVNTGTSPWVSSPSQGLRDIYKFFLPGNDVVVEWVDGNNVAYTAQFKIIEALPVSGSPTKAYVTLVPNKSTTWWAAHSSDGLQNAYKPTAGTVSLLMNSVSDYESHGYQLPGVNDLTLVEYWQQTFRWSYSYNEEYVKALESPLTSEFFKKFRSLPLAKQRAQQEAMLERMMMNAFFYQDEINEYQTVEGYTSLPKVYDPADSNYPIEFKANTLGIRTQIGRCGRVGDKQGLPLDIDWIMESCYNLKRNRETGASGAVEVIDSMTGRFNKGRIRDVMIKYYKARYSADLTMYAQLGQKIQFNGATVFEYDLYDLPDQGVQWAVFTDTYFDDRISAFAAGQKNRANAIWFIDWSDVAINVVRTNSAKRTTNEADELYRYVITPNVKQTLLNSKTVEVRVGDANRHSLIENFSDACPKVTVQGCDLTTA